MTSLQNLLAVEDSDELRNFRCDETGIPFWPGIRQTVLRIMLADLVYQQDFASGPAPTRAMARARLLLRAVGHNRRTRRRLRGRAQITVFATGAGNIQQGDRLFNRVSDHFIQACPHASAAIEDSFGWTWPFPRANPAVLLHAPINARLMLPARMLARRHRQRARSFVDLIATRARDHVGFEIGQEREDRLAAHLARWLARLPYAFEEYSRQFRKLGTRLLIAEEGCYGNSAPMIVAARSLGILTAEGQHGLISKGHDAYNFAPAVASWDQYRQTLPDVLLTYGEWWGKQLNAPLRRVVIGNPHRSEVLQGWRAAERTDILVLGDGIDTPLYRDFCAQLAKDCGGRYRIVFRPHPLERRRVFEEGAKGGWRGIHLDQRGDIYDAFETCSVLIGEVSTGLFEAVGLVDRIIVWNTPKSRLAVPDHPFATIERADDLAGYLDSAESNRIDAAMIEAIWASNWRAHYSAFVEQVMT